MTPFESELLQTAWPVLSSVLSGFAVWYLKTLTKSLESLSQSLDSLRDNMAKVEGEIKTDLAQFKLNSQHRIDQLVGGTNSRLGNIETKCSMQHGVTFRRRSTDVADDWAQQSDVNGSYGR
jgi:hypothetical protein